MPTLYRVENQITMIGLWYNAEGEKVDFVKTIPQSLCHDVPMDFDPEFAGGWYSAGESLEQMGNWFSANDVSVLSQAGYDLYRVEVPEYRQANGHGFFRREGAIFTPVPISLLEVS
jgi:hypothetical protein